MKRHWLDDPYHVRLLWRIFLFALVLTVAAEIAIALHPHFAVEALFGFHAWFGFLACAGGFFRSRFGFDLQLAARFRFRFRAGLRLGEHPRHEGYERWLSRQGTEDPRATAAPDDVAMQIYTSGTTGLPKGAMLTNQNFARLPDLAGRWGLNPASINVVAMPLFHIGGSG